jgi:general secretion pathway protein G
MKLRQIRSQSRGFSLVELLVVVVIIAVLAMIMIPHFQDSGRRSKESALHSNLALLRSAIASFYADTGTYPAVLSDLMASSAPTNGLSNNGTSTAIVPANWHGPYVTTSIPTDPVANAAFNYSTTGTTTGQVSSSASGSGLDGTAYNTW